MQSKSSFSHYPEAQGLYSPALEHDSCGVGFVASIHGTKSHSIIQKALDCVCGLVHRGAVDADAKSGDGAGVLTQIPHKLFRREIEKLGQQLFHDEDLGVGMFFLPRENAYHQAHIRNVTEEVVKSNGLVVLGWRPVPCNERVMGDKAAFTAPKIEQVFIARTDASKLDDAAYERLLYLSRNTIERRLKENRVANFYISSFSSKTIVYKGMFTATQLQRFYLDLQDPLYETAIGMYHQRYSTNTFPTWALAQPFRMLAHNGEINTVRGNRAWVKARENDLESPFWGVGINNLKPVIQPGGSDSASLDNALELISSSGRGVLHSLTMLVPPAFRSDLYIEPDVQAFYEFHELISEPWDGPAALAVSDGRFIAASLDRNGLRPARYKITQDGLMYLGSEMGVGAVPETEIVEKGRLSPGEMIAIDTEAKKLLRNNEIKQLLAKKQPYGQWVKDNVYSLTANASHKQIQGRGLDEAALLADAMRFGFNEEEYGVILKPMIQTGQEPVGSMGDDTPLAVLSERPRPLYHYFRQLFAQVTNPPIDPIRESLVMNISVFLGRKPNGLDESPAHAKLIRLESPTLTNSELEEIKKLSDPAFASVTLPALFTVSGGAKAFVEAVDKLVRDAEEAVDQGKSILVISDRGANAEVAGIPMLLAVSGVHQHLIKVGKRMRTSIVVESAEVRDVHQFGCLVAYGASAVNPYLVWDLIELMKAKGELNDVPEDHLVENYKKAIEKGLYKIMSKMGISKLSSYHGGQLFEAIGLHESVIDRFFSGTTSFISGIRLEDIGAETIRRHQAGVADAANGKLPQIGYYAYRREGERHAVTPPVLQSLHTFVGLKGADKANRMEDYKAFAKALENNRPVALRDLLRFQPGKAISVDEVESIEEIRQRFTTAGMSFGAISPEAHETLAIAMNRIGGKSNSGEGGEDRSRFTPMENGDSKNSRIKQVASGRFGVTAEYLASATEIEIKIAQGAKPGEGGQLPSHKVSKIIAKLRYSTAGVVLISPPPHHDIYSIEDLAQLIYDLKQVNPRAKVCVKLVSEAGVGTIAAGVAKAHADIVLVSGHDGGTGASPLSSIKFAGSPWELGVAETQQVLLLNDLRNRITLRTDGGMRTGRDIVIAAILGAEEFNFGTSALIALGCVYVRKCHLNTCPVGVATQDERLRGKFKGTAEGLVNYLNAIAQDVREILASLGVRHLNDIIGRTEYLEQISLPDHPKANTINLKPLLHVPEVDNWKPRYHTWERNDKLEDQPLDDRILQDVKSTLQTKRKITLKYKVNNVYRSIGAQLSGEIAYRYGDVGLPEDTIELQLAGSAGQSIGVFLVNGIKIVLRGEANDYVGEGMNGGKIILLPSADATFNPTLNVICGNTCLYGATGGKLFIYGQAGERYGVRNSGAISVVEGIGDHGCEYMTAGTICVLGPVGKNFGAGMSGGLAYVLDEENKFEKLYNKGMVTIERLDANNDAPLKALIYEHLESTDSKKASEILNNWEKYRPLFWKVVPHPPVDVNAAALQVEEKGTPAKA
ncbi:MAG: glutamate synthase large subunit [Verrucomicrobiales bacterium]|jgi:glutamate synthase (NADPH/NADH) large chain/glutamate synthase (ferredoxin)|nr:glutamate synthase large subunit [Verrucomicrobiales bacterium]